MYLLPEEKEIHISFCPADGVEEWDLYTTEGKMMRRIEKLGITAYKIEKDNDGDVVAKNYKIPFKQIQFVKERKKPQISEERRQQLKENIVKLQESKRAKQLQNN